MRWHAFLQGAAMAAGARTGMQFLPGAGLVSGAVHRRPKGGGAILLGLLALLFTLAAPPVFAAGGATVGVTATVLSNNNCRFRNPSTTTLQFGNIDPTSSGNATATPGTLTIRCGGASPTVAYAITHDSGLYETGVNANRMKHATLNEYLPYTITVTPSSGTMAKNVDQVITVNGTITPAQFQNAFLGAYSDTVTLTVAP